MLDLVSEGRAGELFSADECTYSLPGNCHIRLQGFKAMIWTRPELSIFTLKFVLHLRYQRLFPSLGIQAESTPLPKLRCIATSLGSSLNTDHVHSEHPLAATRSLTLVSG